MCNACGLLCCGSDQLDGCGCNRCGEPDCAERCQDCGDDIEWCHCDDEDDDAYPEEYIDG